MLKCAPEARCGRRAQAGLVRALPLVDRQTAESLRSCSPAAEPSAGPPPSPAPSLDDVGPAPLESWEEAACRDQGAVFDPHGLQPMPACGTSGRPAPGTASDRSSSQHRAASRRRSGGGGGGSGRGVVLASFIDLAALQEEVAAGQEASLGSVDMGSSSPGTSVLHQPSGSHGELLQNNVVQHGVRDLRTRRSRPEAGSTSPPGDPATLSHPNTGHPPLPSHVSVHRLDDSFSSDAESSSGGSSTDEAVELPPPSAAASTSDKPRAHVNAGHTSDQPPKLVNGYARAAANGVAGCSLDLLGKPDREAELAASTAAREAPVLAPPAPPAAPTASAGAPLRQPLRGKPGAAPVKQLFRLLRRRRAQAAAVRQGRLMLVPAPGLRYTFTDTEGGGKGWYPIVRRNHIQPPESQRGPGSRCCISMPLACGDLSAEWWFAGDVLPGHELHLPAFGPLVIGAVAERDCDVILDVATVSGASMQLSLLFPFAATCCD